jgi:hypothetical protein
MSSPYSGWSCLRCGPFLVHKLPGYLPNLLQLIEAQMQRDGDLLGFESSWAMRHV